MIDFNQPEIKFALESVRMASLLVSKIQAEMVTPALTKHDRSPVTLADYSAQALLGSRIEQYFPGDVLVAEESSEALNLPENFHTLEQVTSYLSRYQPQASADLICRWIDLGKADPTGRYWVLDPIDGTKGFLRHDQYAVALALVENCQVKIGVLGCPNLVGGSRPDYGGCGSLVIAVRGEGTWVTPLEGTGRYTQLHVSTQFEPAQARILRSVEAGHTNMGQIDLLAEKLGVRVDPVQMDSQAKYAVLAAGEAEMLLRMLSPDRLDYREKIWDQAAGSIVIEEAGGKITDLDGKPLDFSHGRTLKQNRGVLASNGLFHDDILRALSALEADL
jgi:3'(2'), 5'-bisphosphate nucleotidase